VNGLSWYWIAIEATAAPIVGLLVALPLWYTAQPILGNIAGTVVIFGTAVGLILREHIQIDTMVRKCIDEGVPCFPQPDAFTRFAVYAFIALFEVIVLFTYSLRVERKLRDRGYAPEWR
jgi:hypothetical protein